MGIILWVVRAHDTHFRRVLVSHGWSLVSQQGRSGWRLRSTCALISYLNVNCQQAAPDSGGAAHDE